METTRAMIELRSVTKTYELGKDKAAVTAVRDLDLVVDGGEFVVVTGRSGSGKTTLLNLIAGLTRPTAGQVLVAGLELWRLPDRQQSAIRNQKIGFIFQFPSLMPSLTALENVILPTMATKGAYDPEVRRRAINLLEEVDLVHKRDALPRQLSAGQQQRVVIARSLINRPELLLADEPTSNLDEQTEHEIMALIQRIHAQRNMTIVLVTHSFELRRYGTQSVRMAAGQIEAQSVVAVAPEGR